VQAPSARFAAGSLLAALTVLGLSVLSRASAAERPWLKLQATRFGMVSQLGEQSTRQWAGEFDQFIDAMHQLYAVKDVELLPLTVVLFDQARDFAPYHSKGAFGGANVAGFFGNQGTWSVIGLARQATSADTRRTVYHEAVHWFLSAAATQPPPWFEEGIAEVFSTFEVKSGKARWGAAIQDDVDYLRDYGIQPLDEFLRIVKSDVLHTQGYYPQAWLFMHYMMFGDNGANLPKFREFLRLRRETDLDTAFAQAFGKTYKDVTAELRAYLQGGRYRMALLDTTDHSAEMTTEHAPPAAVEFALARLAVAGGNDELGKRHVETVVQMAPKAPQGYELRAALARRAGDAGAALNDLDQAITLGSHDADTFSTKAFLLIESNQRDGARADELLPHDLARTIADLFDRSIDLRPRSRNSYEGLATALLNVQVVTAEDDAALAAGRSALPSDGVVLVGQGVVARQRGNFAEAMQLLRRARAEPFDLPARYRPFATNLYNAWLVEWLATQVQRLDDTSHIADSRAFLEEESKDTSLAESSLNLIKKLKGELSGIERFQAGLAARREGRHADADGIFAEVANDSSLSPPLRGAARSAARPH